MKKYWHIALMLFCVLMITSCGDDDEALEVDEVWKVPDAGSGFRAIEFSK